MVPRTMESSTSSTFLPANTAGIAFSFLRTLSARILSHTRAMNTQSWTMPTAAMHEGGSFELGLIHYHITRPLSKLNNCLLQYKYDFDITNRI